MPTILVTGFGPFPGAPRNPTAALVRRLRRTNTLTGTRLKIVTHVFRTSYQAVDRDLPALVKRHRPDALLMFGLSGRARILRIETSARNSLGRNPDVAGAIPKASAISRDGPKRLAMATPARALLAAARAAKVPAVMSRDAGNYLCNYLCWRATELAAKPKGPQMAAFVHVPDIASSHAIGADALARAGGAMLLALAAALAKR